MCSGVAGNSEMGESPPLGPKKYEVIHFLNKKIRESRLKICIFAYEVVGIDRGPRPRQTPAPVLQAENRGLAGV